MHNHACCYERTALPLGGLLSTEAEADAEQQVCNKAHQRSAGAGGRRLALGRCMPSYTVSAKHEPMSSLGQQQQAQERRVNPFA